MNRRFDEAGKTFFSDNAIYDAVEYPAHYAVYPVQPIELTRHLDFCLGNAVKYTLRAPYKGGFEDCEKAIKYLEWVKEGYYTPITAFRYRLFNKSYEKLSEFLAEASGDALWEEIASNTLSFLSDLNDYLLYNTHYSLIDCMSYSAEELARVLNLRDTVGQIYQGMSGLPNTDSAKD